jgi:predicted phage tail protein
MANSAVSLTDNGNSFYFSGLRTNGTAQEVLVPVVMPARKATRERATTTATLMVCALA